MAQGNERWSELDQREWARHFDQTYIRIRNNGSWKVAWVESAEAHGGRAGVTFSAKLLNKDRISARVGSGSGSDVEVDTSFPTTGYFNFLGKEMPIALYFERDPNRQWKRGICNTNCLITNFVFTEVHRALGMISREFRDENPTILFQGDARRAGANFINIGRVEGMWDKNFVSYSDAIKQIEEGKSPMLALDSDTAISVAESSENLLLWKGAAPVAEIKKETEVMMRSPIFRQEVVDYFNRARRYDVSVK